MRKKNAHFSALRLLVAIAVVAGSLRALVPIGYMASLDGGRFAIVPCSGVVELTAGLHALDGGAHHSHHGDAAPTGQQDAPRNNQHGDLANCPFAVGCCAALSFLQIDLPASFTSSPAIFRKLSAPIADPHAYPFSARGPPSSF